MKISKPKFLRVLSKYLAKKLGHANLNESNLVMLTTSLTPMFTCYVPVLKKHGIMDEDERVYIEKLEEEANKFFTYVPTFNIPMGIGTLSITKEDIQSFIKELYSLGDVEEVIHLPCQN